MHDSMIITGWEYETTNATPTILQFYTQNNIVIGLFEKNKIKANDLFCFSACCVKDTSDYD